MKKVFRIASVVFLVLLVILVVGPQLFKERIKKEMKDLANRQLISHLEFSGMRVSFFDRFPVLTLSLLDLSLEASPPFSGDTLISAKEIAFGVDLASLFGKTIRISRIYFDQASVEIRYSPTGEANYHVVRSSDTEQTDTTVSSSGMNLDVDYISFRNGRIIYDDPVTGLYARLNGFGYSGTIKMKGNIMELRSRLEIDLLDLDYGGKRYLDGIPFKAKLDPVIRLDSLTLGLPRGELEIGHIPVEVEGHYYTEGAGFRAGVTAASVIGKDYIRLQAEANQADTLWIKTTLEAMLDLKRWTRAIKTENADLRGIFRLSLEADGPFMTGPDTSSLRGGTMIRCIPDFTFTSSLDKGYLKYHFLPEPVSPLEFRLDVSSTGHAPENIRIALDSLVIRFLNNHAEGHLRVDPQSEAKVDANLSVHCTLSDLGKVFPLDSIGLSGRLDLDARVRGDYAPERGIFPLTTAVIDLKDGFLKTPYYPSPVEKIDIHVDASDQTGTMQGLHLNINPFTFLFEGKSFMLNATLNDFEDLNYSVHSQGVIDVGKIYQVFSQEGMSVEGFIETDLTVQGKQSDAEAGRIERLNHSGRLKLQDILFSYELYPKPFLIRSGDFRFEQDKVWFDDVAVSYGSSDFNLRGAVSNVIGYALNDKAVLKGTFQMRCDSVNVDELMVFTPEDTAGQTVMVPGDTVASGVMIIPDNLNILFRSNIRSITFQGLNPRDFHGEVVLKTGVLVIRKTGFDLAGCKVGLDASYGSVTPMSAFFDFHIAAEDLDIKRAYHEIALIRELAPAAEYAEGIISLDYAIKGRLDSTMYPVMESLEGGGTLSLRKVKVKGFRLFNDIGKKTQKEELKNPDMSKVDITASINEKVITLEPFKFKVSGIHVRIGGTAGMDNRVNLRIRLGLPPLGIFGIPMKVTGAMDDPVIKFGRGREGEEIQEEEYTDELPQELIDRIRNAREEEEPEIH